MNGDRIILAAHRGDQKRYPENTMPAFHAALAAGVDMIETDIRQTKDGHLIIMHDRTALRTAGVDRFIREMTLEEVLALDAGYLFDECFKGTNVPTVEEFIAFLKGNDLLINWELKDYARETGEEFAFRAADQLIALIEENGLAERSMLNSFSNRVLEHIYECHGHRFPLHGQGIGPCTHHEAVATPDEELFDWCCLYPDGLVKDKLSIDFPHNFTYCVEHGIKPCVCIPDTMENYRTALALGCKMFTSNDILEASRILKELKVK